MKINNMQQKAKFMWKKKWNRLSHNKLMQLTGIEGVQDSARMDENLHEIKI